MADPLAPLERWLTAALATLAPPARKRLLADIGRELRKRNQRRMSAQTGPDGKPWPARKRDRSGRVRKTAKMLLGLRETRRMALSTRPDAMELGYAGRNARIAAIHQSGDVDAVGPNGPMVKYPARPLLGLAPDDIAFVHGQILSALETDR